MRKLFFLCVMLVVFVSKAQTDTNRILEVAKMLTVSTFESQTSLENARNSLALVDTFKNNLGFGGLGLNYNRFMLIKVISQHCEYILAYDGAEGGKYYRLKGFDSYSPADVREIIDNLNFDNPPPESYVNELDHLKYCTSAFKLWIFKRRIPKSCTSLREEEYRLKMRSYRGDVPPR